MISSIIQNSFDKLYFDNQNLETIAIYDNINYDLTENKADNVVNQISNIESIQVGLPVLMNVDYGTF